MRQLLILLVLFIVGCNESKNNVSYKTVDIDFSYSDVNIEKITDKNDLNITLGENPKDLYLVFTNPSKHSSKINVVFEKEQIKKYQTIDKKENIFEKKYNNILYHSQEIEGFNHRPLQIESTKKSSIVENFPKEKKDLNRRTFFLGRGLELKTEAILKRYIKAIPTAYGEKSLKIWVSEESFIDAAITQDMIDTLADSFLKVGDDNDIYDWVTNIFGEEWGKDGIKTLIDDKNEIVILLTDIDNDKKIDGGVSGYFYSKDNYKQEIYKGSNEMLMFYIDAPIFADNPKKSLSTLAHEFEHMINFYQKKVKYNGESMDSWIDEMLALSTEDLLATKLKTLGIRGIPSFQGNAGEYKIYDNKLARFNKNINESLLQWDGELKDYSKVSAFGGYLMRNYGGAEILHNILHNSYDDKKAIEYAVEVSLNGSNKTFDEIIQDWGIAILLSSEERDDDYYTYNKGDFFDLPFNKTLYNLGSINFFNYYIQPLFSEDPKILEPNSNLYYKVGEKLSGNIRIKIEKASNIRVALVSKS